MLGPMFLLHLLCLHSFHVMPAAAADGNGERCPSQIRLYRIDLIVIRVTVVMLLLLGGSGQPSVSVVGGDDSECQLDPTIPDVPQPYGSPGRSGSLAGYHGGSVVVCGGDDDSAPPFSSFKDCHRLDLDNR